MAMGDAAAELDITIQYCMPLPMHILQSVEIQAVTQVRASNDYQHTPAVPQWEIAYSSLLEWSIGLIPFKDDFWTTMNQTGCPSNYPSCLEYNTVLETLVATLSTGPVGFADAIGATNAGLVMQSCNAMGLLLKADKPATPIDKVFVQFGSAEPEMIQVWDTFSEHSKLRWHYVLGANLSADYDVYPHDLELKDSDKFVTMDYFNQSHIKPFDKTHSLKLPKAKSVTSPHIDFSYHIVAPVMPHGWVVLGEVGKFVTMSHQRITGVTFDDKSVTVTAEGKQGEVITLAFYQSGEGELYKVPCTVGSSLSVQVICNGPKCSCH